MLTKERIAEVMSRHLMSPTTPTEANRIAAELGLAPGSVRFGPKAIEIVDGSKTVYCQITPEGDVELADNLAELK